MFDVADQHVHELRVAIGEENAKCVGHDVVNDAECPELKPKSKGCRNCSVHDRCCARRAAHKNGLSQ